jgi:hypothetical protein
MQNVRSVCVARFGKKDILQCVTKWMAKNTVPVTIWGVPVWKGGGRRNISHLGTPRNHKVFVTIWGLTCILHILSIAVTPSSSYAPFRSLVLYRFLHTYFFSCTEVLSM